MNMQEAIDSWLTAIKLQGHGYGGNFDETEEGCGPDDERLEFWSVGNGKDNLIIVRFNKVRNTVNGVYNLYDDAGITSGVRCHKKVNSDDVGVKKALKEITSWVALL